MTAASRLGQLWRRDASLGSVKNVRALEEQRVAKLGATSDELNARFAQRVAKIEARVAALEVDVLGGEKTG